MLFVNIRQTPGTQPYCHSRFLTSALPIYGRYDWDRPDPRHDGYYADNYYRNDRRYRERRLSNDDRIYRGRDGKYYCRRNDGSTGLIVGGIAGGVLGNVIAPGDSTTLGTVLGDRKRPRLNYSH